MFTEIIGTAQMKAVLRSMANDANFDYETPKFAETPVELITSDKSFHRTNYKERQKIKTEMKRRGLTHLIVPDKHPKDERSAEQILLHG